MAQSTDSDLFAVIGLGLTGMSCVEYLCGCGKQVIALDTRDAPPALENIQKRFPSVETHVGGLNLSALDRATHVIVSPGISLQTPEIAKQVKEGKPVWGDIELFAQAVSAPVIAITGTNAKSTVTTMVGEMIRQAGLSVKVGGNIGVPVLTMLQESAPDVFVLELSSFQLETTQSLRAKVACVLNVSPDHLDRYASLQHYQAAKLRVYHRAEQVVSNRDDSFTQADSKEQISFGLGAPAVGDFGLKGKSGLDYLAFGNELLMPVSELAQAGRHEQVNALAALAIGHTYGLPFGPMLTVLRSFQGLPHRCQLVLDRDGVRWINDSKGTNVGATIAALEGLGGALPGQIVLIAGGVGKGADFGALATSIQKHVKHVVLIGESAESLHEVLKDKAPCSYAGSMQEAVEVSGKIAESGDSVLLSPACASFDMFDDYGHRGQVFTEIVQQNS